MKMSHQHVSSGWQNGVYKGAFREIELIRKMAAEGATSKIKVEIDQLLYYRKSRTGIFVGSLVEPLLSDGQVFVKAGDNCKIKIKFDALDLIKMRNTKMMEFIIKNSCEEKMLNGTFVKQITACSVSDYISEDQKTFKMKF